MKAVAEAAIAAKQVALDARKAATEAGGTDEALNAEADTAEQVSRDASAKAASLSQAPAADPDKDRKKAKLKRKQGIIARQLAELGDEPDDEDDGLDDLDDDNKPLTMGDLKRIEADKAKKTAVEMAGAIEDPEAAKAVKEALGSVVASGDPVKDFQNAVAIASATKNSQVLEEIRRKGTSATHRNGAGAPARQPEPEFVMTEEERRFVAQGWLTEVEVKKARSGTK